MSDNKQGKHARDEQMFPDSIFEKKIDTESHELSYTKMLKNLAFPLVTSGGNTAYGLTKREYIATQLMSGAITHSAKSYERMVHEVIRITDLLLTELNKEQ